MATKKTTQGLKLESLIGKDVRVRCRYDDPEDEKYRTFKVVGIDSPMICFEFGGSRFWWNLRVIEALVEAQC
jgi:hypothetical protein